MAERPPRDDRSEDPPVPPDEGHGDTFEREIEGELQQLRHELASEGELTEQTPDPEPDEAEDGATVEADALSLGDDEEDLEREERLAAAQDPTPHDDGPVDEPSASAGDESTVVDDGAADAIAAADDAEGSEGLHTEEFLPEGEELVAADGDVPEAESEVDVDGEAAVESDAEGDREAGDEPVTDEPDAEGADGEATDDAAQEPDAVPAAATAAAAAGGEPAGAAGAAAGAGVGAAPGAAGAAVGAGAAAATGFAPITDAELELLSGGRKVGMLAKFLAASMVIVASIATAVSLTVILGLNALGNEIYSPPLGDIAGVSRQIDPGEPATILLLGSDQRAGETGGRSDTAMLLRLDPDKELISLMSLPRDLRVNIPGIGVDRLNAAYALGGAKKAVETIQQLTDLEINHVVNIDFLGFAKGVDALDCVYVDIDQNYFNDNSQGGDRYAEIDINPGYQRMCGFKALQYVRFRHTDSDVVRGARQQEFVREARPKIPEADVGLGILNVPLLGSDEGDELVDIFKKHTSSDIKSARSLLDLLDLLVASRSSKLNQVRLDEALASGAYLTASDDQMQRAVAEFLGEEPPLTPEEEAERAAREQETRAERQERRKRKENREKDPTPSVELVDVSDEGKRIAEIVDEADTLKIAAMYPRKLPPGASISEDSRGYRIKSPDRKRHRSYKLVLEMPGPGFTEYFGIMGTPWKEAPILDHPHEVREIEGTEYKLYFAGDRLRMIAWETDDAVYWLNNTLQQSLTEQEMIAIVTSLGSFR